MSLNMEYQRKIEYFINVIPKRMYEPVDVFGFEAFFTYDRLTLEEALSHKRQPVDIGALWGRKWEYGWFFAKITIPVSCKGKRVVFAAKQAESLVFVNGKVAGAFDKEHTHITLSENANPGDTYDIVMEAYAGHDKDYDNIMVRDKVTLVLPGEKPYIFPENVTQRTVTQGTFGVFREEVFQLWMDIRTLYDLRNNLDKNSLRSAKIDKALMKMCDVLNIELPGEEFEKNIQAAREILKPVLDCKNGSTAPVIYAIGHSHLDLEWLWTKEETRRKAARTLGNQLRLIEEYPDYKYIQSQPWLLETVKNEYPDLYENIKSAVRKGNIIVEGGMYVESDTNIISGESLIRQFMTGKRFIKEEFGTDSDIFWLPDSFGMSGSLPQIMKGCGIKYFMNAKITWQYNGGDKVPFSNFMWQGIDGSEILTNLTQEYATEMTPSKVFEKWEMNNEKADVPYVLLSYGHGDGGGGATRIHLEYIKREADLEGMPKVISESPVRFFEKLENECEINERYVGELYYTAHRGTYTTRGMTKKLNRKSEFALREAEMWSALFDKNTKYETDALWKTLLFNQFHDIIPGTSLGEVHDKSEKELAGIIDRANSLSQAVAQEVTDNKKEYITVFNSLSEERKAIVTLPDGYTSAEGCVTQKNGDKVSALVTLPPCGYKSFRLGFEEALSCKSDDSLILENDLVRAEFNQNGEMISLFDKTCDMEFLSKPSNVLRMYRDMTCLFDAWDIDSCYENQEEILEKEARVSVEYKGEIESALLIKRRINSSCITQRVILRKDSKRIDFETEIDWKETHKLLKVDFDTDIQTEDLISEIQFGYIKRPNHKTRPYDKDRFEVCNYKWSALCESKRGVAILNDCKYGISSYGGKMSLTLLRSSVNPSPDTDMRVHNFTYSVMPFSGSLADSNVIEESYELNSPVISLQGFAEEKSFFAVSHNNIIIDTVKLAEDGSGDIIVRMYESKKTRTRCSLKAGTEIKSAYITDMLENNISEADVLQGEISLDFRAFEVVTLRLQK